MGLYVALWPTWGDHVTGIGGDKVFTAANARVFSQFIGHRFRNKPNLLLVNGGDRYGDASTEIWQELAAGYKRAAPNLLLSYHPMGPGASSTWFHKEDWLDFNSVQTGHFRRDDPASYRMIESDYARIPAKPTMDIEARYEEHAINWGKDGRTGVFDDYDVRQAAYWSVFAGAHGHSYGSQAVWGTRRGDFRIGLDRPGAFQMRHIKDLLLSRPYFSRTPDQSLIADSPGEGRDHVRATRGDGYAFIYLPTGRSTSVHLGGISWKNICASWFDPRTGKSALIGTFPNRGTRLFDPLGESGRGNDWVLALDDAARRKE